ncbi:MAG: RNA pseudouridine synthase [Elusimicrobiales bacterium]|nr:RNA pseudouridine synthase [Elusimicrobiales bacterium]
MENNLFKLIYIDDNLITVSKKYGIPVTKGRGDLSKIENLTDILIKEFGNIYRVHRIDKDTSGLIVFARNKYIHRDLSILFENRKIIKKYLAIVWGIIDKKIKIDKPIREFASGRCGVDYRGKNALTYITPIKQLNEFTLIEAYPFTGRRHQIRVHLYDIGHPIVGDPLYGDLPKQKKYFRMFLHSAYISFYFNDYKYSFEDSDEFLKIINETF